jgi:hypothetical protein
MKHEGYGKQRETSRSECKRDVPWNDPTRKGHAMIVIKKTEALRLGFYNLLQTIINLFLSLNELIPDY